MIRGKKNFLPPSHLILGLSFLFRLEDGSVERHKGERKVIAGTEEEMIEEENKEEVEVVLDDSDDEKEEVKGKSELSEIKEEEESEVKEEKEAESSEGSDDEVKFPDTQIKIQHVEGTK